MGDDARPSRPSYIDCNGAALVGCGGLYPIVGEVERLALVEPSGGGDLVIRQSDLSGFAEGPLPPRGGDVDDEGDLFRSPPPRGRGRKCAKCGKPLNGGGLELLGFGLVCWRCFNKGGRRDGRGDLSSDATAERNAGYNWRR